MPTLGLIGIVVLALLVLGALAPRVFAAAAPAKTPPAAGAPGAPAANSKAPALSMKELQERLARLAESAPVIDPSPRAMCYEMAAPPATADYLCPVDGSRTQYARGSGMIDLVHSLPSLRQAVKDLPGLDAALDEKEMCRQCSPAGHGGVALVIKHPDGKVVRTGGVTSVDLQLLREFLSGAVKHEGGYGEETPLKQHLPRIRALLGLDKA